MEWASWYAKQNDLSTSSSCPKGDRWTRAPWDTARQTHMSECRFTAFYTHGALIFVPVAWKLESACRLQWRFGQISQDFRQSGSQTHSACAILCHSVPGRCSLDQTSEAQVGIINIHHMVRRSRCLITFSRSWHVVAWQGLRMEAVWGHLLGTTAVARWSLHLKRICWAKLVQQTHTFGYVWSFLALNHLIFVEI